MAKKEYVDSSGLSHFLTKLKTLIDKKVDAHSWNAISHGGTWSRICHVNCQSNVIGSSFFLNVRGTRSSVVFNATFIVTTSHSQQANIIQLQSTSYSPFQIRTLSDANGSCYIEIYDDVAGISTGAAQTLACTLIPITTGTVTKYTSFTNGATIPSGYVVAKTMTVTAENAIVADSFIGNLSGDNAWITTVHGSLDGNAKSASSAPWSGITDKPSTFTPSSHNHDGAYVPTTEAGTNSALNRLSTDSSAPVDDDYFISQYVSGGTTTTSYHRRPVSALWSYIKGKADKAYQAKGSYAALSHTHDDRYYTESEIDSKVETLNSELDKKATISHTHEVDDISNLQAALDCKAESNHVHSTVTTSSAGFMSSNDKSKLDEVESGANKYILPVAGSSIGGVKSGTDITVDASGNVSVNNDSHSHSAETITSVNASAITGVIAEANLPSYVDDVLEYDTKDDFPANGESGKIYVDITTNLAYRWGGSAYVEISPSLALGETYSTAYRGDRGKTAYEHSQENGNPHGTTIGDIDGLQSALDSKADSSHTHNYAGSSSAGGSANSAVKLETARTIGAGTAVTSTAQSFNGESNIIIPINSVKESYLDWGGKSVQGSLSPVGMALSSEHNANRLAFINGNALTMEYSSDGGSTWKDYGYSAEIKSQFCTTNVGIPIGRASASSNYTTSSRTRITIDGQSYVYTNPRKLLINISSSGQMNVLVEYKTGASGASWQTFGTYSLVGWSGWNDIPLVLDTFGGYSNVATTNRYLRMTFIMTSVDSNYPTTAQVSGIRLFGSDNWICASENNNKGVMSYTGHLYSYDINANATFPADVKAPSFSGVLNGSISSVTTSGTGEAYTASVNGITALTAGITFTMIPHTVSTTISPTLNVNGLGAKNIRMRLTNLTQATTGLRVANFLSANKPVKMMYDGTYWIVDDVTVTDANCLYGKVPITSGGTGADNATSARVNLGIETPNGTIRSTNADYAEVGEWVDGNTNDEDRVGYFVAVDDTTAGATMVKATSISDVRGVTVASPAFSGNCSNDKFDSSGTLLNQYDYVAVMGLVSVIDNGTCTINGRCMPNDEGTAVPSPNNMGYQVINRIDSTHILIAVEPGADMLVRIKDAVTELRSDVDALITTGSGEPTSSTKGSIYIQTA